MRTVFVSRNVVLPGRDDPEPATIEVDSDSGKILRVVEGYKPRSDYPLIEDNQWIDVGHKYILPGLVDAHVHLNEPGRTDWEGFRTGTRAALSGGVTTVIDMPLNSIPPTTNVENLETKRKVAKGQCYTDVGFWGGVIPGNETDLTPLIDAGVKGFKCFMIDSGVEEFPCVNENDLVKAIEEINSSTVLMFHAELDDPEHSSTTTPLSSPGSHYSTFLQSRPPKLETSAISLIISLLKRYPFFRGHIVHLSAADALPAIRDARAAGLKLTVETCFHYLCLTSSSIPDGRPEFKCCPPIRDQENRDALWAGLIDGSVDFVVSDHSPCVAELKRIDTDGDFMQAWGGISTLGLGLSLLWTEGKKRDISIPQIIRWMSDRTAKHSSVDTSKGMIKDGFDADLVIFDPNESFVVTKESLNFKNKLTPYEGLQLSGRVKQTWLRGRLVFEGDNEDKFLGLEPSGRFV